MLTEEHRKYHRMYEENIPDEVRWVIDDVMNKLISELKELNYVVDTSDSAERVVADITRYFIHSNPSFRNAKR